MTFTRTFLHRLHGTLALVVIGALTACSSPLHRAPVEDRSPTGTKATPAPNTASNAATTPPATPPVPPTEAPKLPPGSENAGKPGYYTVKAGDTLVRVGLETGQNWRDIQKWNSLDNPNVIEVGQVLRVFPPGQDASTPTTRPVAVPKAETRPLDAKPAPVAASGAPTPSITTATTSPSTAPASAAPGATPPATPVVAAAATVPPSAGATNNSAPASAPRDGDEDVNWLWPASGQVLSGFDEVRHKGLSISGKFGDPVFAAADGRVVYAGSGLRGYGNLVIIKHNNTYLTAYAHNQSLLVKEDQLVRRGQKIAEMGSSDTDRVQLHFEIRRQGKPIDPARLLPAR